MGGWGVGSEINQHKLIEPGNNQLNTPMYLVWIEHIRCVFRKIINFDGMMKNLRFG